MGNEKITGFKINDSEQFSLGEHIDSVTKKLKHNINFTLHKDENSSVLYFEDTGLELVFDADDRLVGFINNEADGSSEVYIGITLITEADEELLLTIGEISDKFTHDYINLEEVSDENDELPDMCGYLNYGFYELNGERCLVQTTEMYALDEVVSFIREDIAMQCPIVYGPEGNVANLTTLITEN